MAHAHRRSCFAFALALSACSGASSSDLHDTPASARETSSSDAEVVLHGADLKLDVNAAGRALVVSGGLEGFTALSWGPEAGWSAPLELSPAVATADPSHGSYREVIAQLHELALGDNGEAWVLYSRLSGPLFAASSRIELYARHRPAPGVGSDGADIDWEPAELLAQVGVNLVNDPLPVVATLSLGAAGHVGVVWAQRSEPLLVRTRDPVAGWGTPTALDHSESAGNPLLRISTDAAGNMAIVWQNETDTRAWQGTGRQGTAQQVWTPAVTVAPRTPALLTTAEDNAVWLVSDSDEQGLVAWQQGPTGSATRENLGFGAHHYLYDLGVGVAGRALLAYSVESEPFLLDGPIDGLMVAQHGAGSGWSMPEVYDTGWLRGVQVALNSRGDGIVLWHGSGFGYRRLGSSETVVLGTGSEAPRAAALAEDGRALLAWTPSLNDQELHVRWVE